MNRKSGVLLHISSLPSQYGIGKMGDTAYTFVNFLAESGVQVWQILPLSPTSYGDSPYQSFSVHAGNPYFIDFEKLEEQGLLKKEDYSNIIWGEDLRKVDYSRVYTYCFHVLRTAFNRFDVDTPAFLDFRKKNAYWLEDYALFMSLKDYNHGKPWSEWEENIRLRKADAVDSARRKFFLDIEFYCFLQYCFFQQWNALKSYANQKGITILGDLPIYVAYDSVEVWCNPSLFQLDKNRVPMAVAGCPPDDFSPSGQLWGNPLYNWDVHKTSGYSWWIDRLESAFKLYDIVRIDHFRGFESYYSVPYGEPTAEIGSWKKGPGLDLFRVAEKKLGRLPVIAEDLGFLTEEVRTMLKESGYPGMKIMQFAFDGDPRNEYLPQNFTTTNCVAYTGTHDNMTLKGWVNDMSAKSMNFAKRYLHCRNAQEIPTEILRLTWSSTAFLAVAQMQDFLEAGPEGRMNTPSTLGENWQYRTFMSDFTPRLANRILQLNELYNRLPENMEPKDEEHRSRKPMSRARSRRRSRNERERRRRLNDADNI